MNGRTPRPPEPVWFELRETESEEIRIMVYDGSGYVWRDDRLHRVNDNGSVELEPVPTDDLSDAESAGVSRRKVAPAVSHLLFVGVQ